MKNYVYEIIFIHWISYQPFEQPGPEDIYFNMLYSYFAAFRTRNIDLYSNDESNCAAERLIIHPQPWGPPTSDSLP